MLKNLKKWIKSSFFRNHHVIPVAPHDMRNRANDPRELHYTSSKSILIDARIDHGRTAELFSLTHSVNPFLGAVKRALQTPDRDKLKTIQENLGQYYSTIQPKDPFEWYGLQSEDAPKLKSLDPWAAPLPWVNQTIDNKKKSVKKWVKEDNLEGSSSIDINDGFTFFGPVSGKKIEVESLRYCHLIQSVCDKGFIRGDQLDGDICGEILINGKGQWRWITGPGNHRSIVLSALGYQSVPIRVLRIIYENDVAIWPNVTSGLYTKEGALKLFHTIFEGNAPHIHHLMKKSKQ